MTTSLIATLLGLALVDSINPSALVITIILLVKSPTEYRLRNALAYSGGIFVSYLIIGALLLFGVDGALEAARSISESKGALLLQAVFGLLLVVFAWLLMLKNPGDDPPARSRILSKLLRPKLLFVHGMYVTTAELMTAMPYFAAIALLVHTELSAVMQLGVLVVYCVVFVLPTLLLVGLYYWHREVIESWLERTAHRRSKYERKLALWFVAVAGVLIFSYAVFKLMNS